MTTPAMKEQMKEAFLEFMKSDCQFTDGYSLTENVFNAGYQAALSAVPAQEPSEAAVSAAMAEGNKLGIKSTDAARIIAAYLLAQQAAQEPVKQEIKAEFEAWYINENHGGETNVFELDSDGEYMSLRTWSAYDDYKKRQSSQPAQEPVDKYVNGWKHSCVTLMTDGVELWVDRCPHCGKPAPVEPVKQESKLQRRIDKLVKRLEDYKSKYNGKEREFTFHAGYDMGYVEGQLSILEELL